MKIEEKYISSSLYGVKSPYSMTPQYITIHNTANDASADNEYKFMTSTNAKSTTGWHIVVDDVKAIYAVPLNRNSFHSGDGANGTGNRKSIGIEICYSKSGGSRYTQAEENCVQLVASLLKKYGWGIDRVKKHQDWSGKRCPHRILDEGRWESFKARIQAALNGAPSQIPDQSPKTIKVGSKVRIGTMSKYKYWVPDEIKILNGIYQIRENVNAGGEHAFDWIDNGIPEACVDICDKNGKKTADSDSRHIRMKDKFVFAKTFTVTKIAKDGQTYYQLDYDGNANHRFWVIGDYLKMV